tara:strand:+ start:9665 stop:10693 length:1029 start_codon:yes stop_codon:yes gene_type:complete
MKKNLRNILALALGLMTTVSFAQDWNVDSRTRIDMSGEGDKMSTDQRVTVGTAWGGDNWGIVLSSDVNYTTEGDAVSALVYEAYATTDLFGFASMNIGRQALSYGSGVFIGTNDWASRRNTIDGMTFAIDNDLVGLDLGMTSSSNDDGTTATDNLWINASKSSGDWSANLLYMSNASNGADAVTNMGLDFAYSAMGGALDLNLSYNTTGDEGEMMDLSGTYTVNDDMSLTAGMASVGENGFAYASTGNMSGDWMSHGNLGELAANEENLYVGGSYNMGDFSLAATMSTVTNTTDDAYERSVTDISVGYSLNDNAALSYRMVTDNNGSETDANYNWLTLTVTP